MQHHQVGLNMQEFAIDDTATDLLVDHANHNLGARDLCLGWGRLSGIVVNGVRPGIFASADGF